MKKSVILRTLVIIWVLHPFLYVHAFESQNYLFDVPRLVGKNFSMLIKVLGKPDSEFIANEIQQDLGIPSMAGWTRVWHWTDVDGSKRISKIKLWVDYDARGNTDGKIHLTPQDDHPELSENELLKLANLRDKKNFEVKFIRWVHDNSVIGGMEVIQRP